MTCHSTSDQHVEHFNGRLISQLINGILRVNEILSLLLPGKSTISPALFKAGSSL